MDSVQFQLYGDFYSWFNLDSIHVGVRYPCFHCEYYSTDKGCLKKHVESIHEGVWYPCSLCEYKAAEKGCLKRHVKQLHEGVRYPCSQCVRGM